MAAYGDRFARWVVRGDLQSPDGAFCSWIDLADGERADPYPEITGVRDDVPALGVRAQGSDVLRRAAEWTSTRGASGQLAAGPERWGSAAFTFDLGMMAHRLLRHGCDAEDERSRRAGEPLVRVLVGEIGAHGELPAGVPRTRPVGDLPRRWSTIGSLHLAKVMGRCGSGPSTPATLDRRSGPGSSPTGSGTNGSRAAASRASSDPATPSPVQERPDVVHVAGAFAMRRRLRLPAGGAPRRCAGRGAEGHR